MLTSVFTPNRYNSYAWTNVIGLLLLLYFGEIAPYTIVFGYFLETIVIGFFNIFKMLIASKQDGSGKIIWFLIPFFVFHYGMFIAIQSVLAFVIIGGAGDSFINEPFQLVDNYAAILALEGMDYVLILLIGTQLLKFIFDYMLPKKYLEFTAGEIMFKPYVRIFIQQFMVVFAMFFIVFLNAVTVAAILLIFLRAIVDFFMVGIRDNQLLLDKLVNKMYDDKTAKENLKKQLLLFSE